MAKDKQWLKQRLCAALGWDEVVVEGVVEAIASAETADEVNSIVQVLLSITMLPCPVQYPSASRLISMGVEVL